MIYPDRESKWQGHFVVSRTIVTARLAFGEYLVFLSDSLCTGTAIDPLNGVFAIGYGRLDIYRHGRSTESVVS